MGRPAKAPRLWQRSDSGHWVILDRGRHIRTGERDRGRAEVALAQYVARRWGRIRKNPPPPDMRAALRAALGRARDRAVRYDRPFDIDEAHLVEMYEATAGCCAVSGLPFRLTHDGPSRCNPYGVSIDRIDSSKGYTRGNVRLVIFFVNSAIADYGESLFREVISAMIQRSNVETVRETLPDDGDLDAPVRKSL